MQSTLYLICGLPGSGKTTFSKKLQHEISGIVLSIDEWLIKKYGHDFPPEKFDEYYTYTRNLIDVEAEKLIKNGKNVILDFGFWKQQERDKYRAKGKEWGSNIVVYYLDSDSNTLLNRLSERNKNRPADALEVTNVMLKVFRRF